MLNWGSPGSTKALRSSTARGRFFFHPGQLHLEPPELLVEFGLDLLGIGLSCRRSVLEEGLHAVEELLLPLADLDRVDLELLGQLGDGLGLLGGLQGDLCLEGRRVLLADSSHAMPSVWTSSSITCRVVQKPGSTIVFKSHRSSDPRFVMKPLAHASAMK